MSDDTSKEMFEKRSFLQNLEEKRVMMRENGDEVRARMNEGGLRTPGEVRAHFAQAANVGIINLEANIIPRIESRVMKMKEAGIDVSAVEADIRTAKDEIANLKTAFESMKALFEGETADKDTVKAAGETIKQAMVEVKEALKSVVESLKSASGQSETTQ